VRPTEVIEAEDHRAAEEAGGQDRYRHGQQRPAGSPRGSAAFATTTYFAQYQNQYGTKETPGDDVLSASSEQSVPALPSLFLAGTPSVTGIVLENRCRFIFLAKNRII
jgi:hypothetical protein